MTNMNYRCTCLLFEQALIFCSTLFSPANVRLLKAAVICRLLKLYASFTLSLPTR